MEGSTGRKKKKKLKKRQKLVSFCVSIVRYLCSVMKYVLRVFVRRLTNAVIIIVANSFPTVIVIHTADGRAQDKTIQTSVELRGEPCELYESDPHAYSVRC